MATAPKFRIDVDIHNLLMHSAPGPVRVPEGKGAKLPNPVTEEKDLPIDHRGRALAEDYALQFQRRRLGRLGVSSGRGVRFRLLCNGTGVLTNAFAVGRDGVRGR